MKVSSESVAAPAPPDIRDGLLRAVVIFSVALFLITESLSAFNLIRPVPLILCWVAIIIAALVKARRITLKSFHPDPIVLICVIIVMAILGTTALTAAFSPPNSADAMAYHMPRVIYWAEQSSIRFFPTQYLNQIMLQPLTEYFMLHTYLLTGGDRFINFIQWFAAMLSVIGVSAIAAIFGAGVRGQAIAALFCAAIPSGILASSGAKNDYFLAMWLIVAVYLALRFTKTCRTSDAVFFGAALGLALLTKATAYLFAPWIVVAIFAVSGRRNRMRLAIGALIAAGCALALNIPHYVRNYDLSGFIMGFDSAQGDGFFRWRNETFGWKQTLSNIMRNASEQLGARSEGWDQGAYDVVLGMHRSLGIDLNDPATTWRWSTYAAPKNANHEANAPNPWHLAILLAMSCIIFWRALRGKDRERAWYALSLLCGFIAFCAYLKWQPFFARLLLPLFVLAAPLTSDIGNIATTAALRILRPILPIVFCLFLLDNARHPLLDNWVRPLRGPKSVLHTPRDDQYFADMSQWNNADSYKKIVDRLTQIDCNTIGIDSTNLQLEYPIQALLRERKPKSVFIHTGVQNVSTRYAQPSSAPACAVVCLDCAGDSSRRPLYSRFTSSTSIDKFVLMTFAAGQER
jgi:hypothetical protein